MSKKFKVLSLILVILLLLSGCARSFSEEKICEQHTDIDDNGLCDDCKTSLLVYIDIYAINDLHGKLDDTSVNEGVDELTSYLKSMIQKDEHSILISSGDMWQGSSESNLTRGALMTDWMNHMGFVSMTLGNHEYDWGEEYIELNGGIADFPFLGINIFDRNTDMRADYCEASVVVERGGVEIGIIGAIGDCYSSISGDKTEDIYFKTGSQLTALVKEEAERLRKEGVDIVIYSIHDGYGKSEGGKNQVSDSELMSYYDVTLSDGYIDLVFEGHTHKNYTLIDSHGVYHMQNGGDNKGISHVELKHNTVTGSSGVSYAAFVSSSVYTSYSDDPIIDELLLKYSDEVAPAYQTLGRTDVRRDSEEIKSLVSELYLKKGIERWGEEYDIVLGGGYISARSPYNVSAGDIKYSDIQSILPFDNQIVLCSVQGKHLLSQFIYSTNKNYYTYLGEYGNSVKSSIDPEMTYYIVTDTYSSSYAANHLSIIEYYDFDVFARDLVAEYIKNGGWSSNK